jgi:hypothetical protein
MKNAKKIIAYLEASDDWEFIPFFMDAISEGMNSYRHISKTLSIKFAKVGPCFFSVEYVNIHDPMITYTWYLIDDEKHELCIVGGLNEGNLESYLALLRVQYFVDQVGTS